MIYAGAEKAAKCFLGDEMIRKVYLGDDVIYQPKSRLPKGYKEVKYIRWGGDKTSFILLENVKASTDKIILKFHPETFSGTMLLVNGKSGTTTYFLSLLQ